ncbi:hypothetical protein [Nibribacter koreensis]|uniref:Lipoprotein n=1 Tax=Nibribacter koreensis TaxID=1084519 RepID=A0ABP8FBE9_9BACT
MRKLLLPITFGFICLSCGSSSNRTEIDEELKASVDSIRVEREAEQRNQARLDSISKTEEHLAIKGIEFGISEAEFNKKKSAFLKPLRLNKREAQYESIPEYRLGTYRFDNLSGTFHKNKLYRIDLRGELVHYNDYDHSMPTEFNALSSLLTEKYGKPFIENPLPEWHTIKDGYGKTIQSWLIGDKYISIGLFNTGGGYYTLNFTAIQSSASDRIIQENTAKSEALKKKDANVL